MEPACIALLGGSDLCLHCVHEHDPSSPVLHLGLSQDLLSSARTAAKRKSIRQRFGLRSKNARAENPLVNNAMQHAEFQTACVLGRRLETQFFINNAFWPV